MKYYFLDNPAAIQNPLHCRFFQLISSLHIHTHPISKHLQISNKHPLHDANHEVLVQPQLSRDVATTVFHCPRMILEPAA
ncbi:hypothetical protein BST61_g9990 [Cercospora zeina]